MLLGILTIFFLSYATRIWWYQNYFDKDKTEFEIAWKSFVLSIPFDFAPLLLMVTMHYRNFSVKEPKKNDEIANENDDILHLNLIEVS